MEEKKIPPTPKESTMQSGANDHHSPSPTSEAVSSEVPPSETLAPDSAEFKSAAELASSSAEPILSEETAPSEETVIEALKTIIDPELYLDIWTLGLIYGIGLDDPNKIHILMTFTSPACPAGPFLLEEVKSKLRAATGIEDVTVEITFSPPWEASEELRQMLGLY